MARKKKSLLLFNSLLILLCWLLHAATGSSDADAVVDLARSLVNPPSTWSTGSAKNVCSSFEGITCSSSGRVTAIDLAGKGLRGTLPSSLSMLTELRWLKLEDNALSGAVPSLGGGAQSSLVHISLGGNNFTSLPDDFLHHGMPALQHLSMSHLPLPPWPFPDAVITGAPSLRNFSASNASITGRFPAAALAASLTSINILALSYNKLTGTLPASLGNMASLKMVLLADNYFQGPMPVFAKGVMTDVFAGNSFCLDLPGPCDAPVTTLLQVAEGFGYPLLLAQSWTGNDPCARGWLGVACVSGHVFVINLAGYNLSGTISPAIANLTGLEKLVLSGNRLTGAIPGALTTLPKLKVLDVRNNGLTGQVPKFRASMRVWADGNRFGEASGCAAAGPGQGNPNGTTSSSSGTNASPLSKWNAAIVLGIVATSFVL